METAHKKCLDKILSSKEFSNSKIYQNYLTYLVESASKGKQLKETTIAIEVFGKDASFNPAEDTIVRSHTYTMRKKLESYYYNAGKADKYRLRIPKGHYETKFVEAKGDFQTPKNLIVALGKRYYILVIAMLLALLIGIWKQNVTLRNTLTHYQIIDKTDPVWSHYFESPKPILIIIGNHFFFNEYSDVYSDLLAMRHPKINSIEDLETYQIKQPQTKLEVTNEPYFPYHSIWSLPPILNLFYSMNRIPIMRKSSEISPQILDEYNIIFLGSIKTLYKLKHTLLKSHFDFEIAPHKVIYETPDTESAQIFETKLHSPGENEDLVLALKLPGPDDNAIMIIASYHSLGAPEIAAYMASPKIREKLDILFKTKYGEIPPFFEVLFRVTGIDKTAYDTEVLVYSRVDADESTDIETLP